MNGHAPYVPVTSLRDCPGLHSSPASHPIRPSLANTGHACQLVRRIIAARINSTLEAATISRPRKIGSALLPPLRRNDPDLGVVTGAATIPPCCNEVGRDN